MDIGSTFFNSTNKSVVLILGPSASEKTRRLAPGEFVRVPNVVGIRGTRKDISFNQRSNDHVIMIQEGRGRRYERLFVKDRYSVHRYLESLSDEEQERNCDEGKVYTDSDGLLHWKLYRTYKTHWVLNEQLATLQDESPDLFEWIIQYLLPMSSSVLGERQSSNLLITNPVVCGNMDMFSQIETMCRDIAGETHDHTLGELCCSKT
jgi:hypothetical protein